MQIIGAYDIRSLQLLLHFALTCDPKKNHVISDDAIRRFFFF